MESNINSDDISNLISCIEKIISISEQYQIETELSLEKYSSFQSSKELMNNTIFSSELHKTLQKLLSFYSERNYIEEKYMMLLISLFFGVCQNTNNNNTKNKKKKKKNTKKMSNIILNRDKLEKYYPNPTERIISIAQIILNTIKHIEEITTRENDEQTNLLAFENSSNEEYFDEVEYEFECHIQDYFYKHFNLFSYSISSLIEMLYGDLEYELDQKDDYILYTKILIENPINFNHLIINKYIRTIELFSNIELKLLSMFDDIDFSDEFDIIKLTHKLKALCYLKKTKFYNHDIVTWDDVKYINRHFLDIKYNITESFFKECYSLDKNNYCLFKEKYTDSKSYSNDKKSRFKTMDKLRKNFCKQNNQNYDYSQDHYDIIEFNKENNVNKDNSQCVSKQCDASQKYDNTNNKIIEKMDNGVEVIVENIDFDISNENI